MKSKKSKIIAFSILVVTLICSVIFAVGATEDTSKDYYKVVPMEVKEYRSNLEDPSVPKYDESGEYIFAGWFTDDTCKTAIATDMQEGTAYAKFVPADILGVKAQINIQLTDDNTENDEEGAIRFVTSVDSLDYSEVGFVFERGKGEEKKSSSKVYETLFVTDANGSTGEKTDEYKPNDLFNSTASKYFKTWTYTNVPDEAYSTEIKATPFWITLDGTTVKAEHSVKCVNMKRQWKYIFVDDNGSVNDSGNETGTGTRGCPYNTLNSALSHIKTYGESTGGEVWVLNSLTAASDSWTAHGLDVTVTGDKLKTKDDITVDFSNIVDIRDSVTFDNMTLTLRSGNLYANGNRFEIASNVVSDNTSTVIFGGSYNSTVESTNITVLKGSYKAIYGGGNLGTVTGDTYVTVKNANVHSTTSGASRVHGGGYKGTIKGNTHVIIGEGFNETLGNDFANDTNYSSVYGGGWGETKDDVTTLDTVKGDTYVTIEADARVNYAYGAGGSASTVQGTSHVEFVNGYVKSIYGGASGSGTNSHTSVKMTGGYTEQIFGGSAQGMTGNTYVQVSGGEVSRRVYGGCYNNLGNTGTWADTNYHVDGYTTVVIEDANALTFDYTENYIKVDNSLFAGSRYETNSKEEVGILVFVDDLYDTYKNNIGYSNILYSSSFNNLLPYNYLVDASAGGDVSADANELHIKPDTGNQAIVKIGDKEVHYTTGESTYTLPNITGTEQHVVTVEFGTIEEDREIAEEYVARIDGAYYTSLENAVGNANANDVIVILKDLAVSNEMTVSNNITLTSEVAVNVTLSNNLTVNNPVTISGNITIQSANNAVTITRGTGMTGDIFNVTTGTFTIQGSEGKEIVIDGNAGSSAMSARAVNVAMNATFNMQYATIQKFNSSLNAVAVYNKGTTELTNVTIKDNTTTSNSAGGAIRNENAELTMTNTVISNTTSSYYGGALYASGNSAKVTIDTCTFTGNTASRGGAIYYNDAYGVVSITNSSFNQNSATAYAGAIAVRTATITNCTFGSNTVDDEEVDVYLIDGVTKAAITISGELTGLTVKYTSNDSKVKIGGAIDTASDITITPASYTEGAQLVEAATDLEDEDASIFKAATKLIQVTPDETGVEWGIDSEGYLATLCATIGETKYYSLNDAVETATSEDTISLVNSFTLRKNITISEAKTVNIVNGTDGTITITRTTTGDMIYLNNADAVLNITGNAGSRDIVFEGGLGAEDAEAADVRCVWVEAGKFNLTNAGIQNFYSSRTNAGPAIYSKGTVVLDNTDIINNGTTTTYAGGALRNQGGTMKITNSILQGNTASNSEAGALYTNNANVTLEDCTFDGNVSNANGNTSAGRGGAIYYNGATQMEITGCTFTGNHAANYGGALWVQSVKLSGCTFESNYTTTAGTSATNYGGGAIYVTNGSLTCTNNCAFEGNYTDGNGYSHGGAIFAKKAALIQIDGCQFTGNFTRAQTNYSGSDSHGGAIYIDTYTNTESGYINNCKFTSNVAGYGDGTGNGAGATGNNGSGGAIGINAATLFNISGCTFTTNIADNRGGAIYTNGSSTVLYLKGCKFDENVSMCSSGSRGDDVQAYYGKVYYDSSCTFSNDTTAINGSGANGTVTQLTSDSEE